MPSQPGPELDPLFDQVLGYLNFSDGQSDPKILTALDQIAQATAVDDKPHHLPLLTSLLGRLETLKQSNGAFGDSEQAAWAIETVRNVLIPAYRKFHIDLLDHLDDNTLLPAFFIGRLLETALAARANGRLVDPDNRTADLEIVLKGVNNFIGHRPVPVLENQQQIEPYAHEWVAPIPLYVRGAGISSGVHTEVLEKTLDLLAMTDPDICRDACFDLTMLDELALDPRAYDFDHPVNKRPNYHFGQWDPHCIDNRGYYRRFVVQHVTLSCLLKRIDEPSDHPRDEIVLEAAAVLAGTILMAAGVSGWGPECHGGDVTLGNMLPSIAAYRDEFYRRLIHQLPASHRDRLNDEAAARRQPFGAARQHLNTELGNRRARQLQRVVLARVFAHMGRVDAALQQVSHVHVASARMGCRLECLLMQGDRAARAGQIEQAVEILTQVRDLLLRAIECGALADPWSVLGFDANYSLFPAMENSVHDHRVDELVDLVERIFQLHARIWSEAAAVDQTPHRLNVEQLFQSLALWWRQFAVHEVSSIDCGDSERGYLAAKHVADGLNVWHKGGAETGDVAFWKPHAAMFDSPNAYTLLTERLLERNDHVASMSLLIHWLSRHEELPLEQGDASFYRSALRWARAVRRHVESPWPLIAKFLNYVEANADEHAQAPTFDAVDQKPNHDDESQNHGASNEDIEEDIDVEEDGDLFAAAYEKMTYNDSTDDGVDGSLAGERQSYQSEDALARECHRVAGRLEFIRMLSKLWTLGALTRTDGSESDKAMHLRSWNDHGRRIREQLRTLMGDVAGYQIPSPLGDHESMMEYDRRRLLKESLLEQVISTEVDVANATRMVTAALLAVESGEPTSPVGCTDEELAAAGVIASLLTLEPDAAKPKFEKYLAGLEGQPLLYIPLSRGGAFEQIATAKVRQACLRDLLRLLPRAGMLREVGMLLETAREMERVQATTMGAVTEFDDLFNTGYGAMVRCLVHSCRQWPEGREEELVECLEQMTESVLISWLAHSRTLRLSVLERVAMPSDWEALVDFIQKYGGDLFTQHFLNLGNVRAILHSGVANWLRQVDDEADDSAPRLFADLHSLDFDQVVEWLTIVLEAIIENYGEYRDYNSTTTLSDDGSMLYSLLDFLRLRSKYDRICWHLKPVVMAHEILVRNQLVAAAELWRRALSEKIDDEADRYQSQLRDLQSQYAMRLSTVADRLGERFTKPLQVDRLVAMVAPSVAEADGASDSEKESAAASRDPNSVFAQLEREASELAEEPMGAGLDVPMWLIALEDEVQRIRQPEFDQELPIDELGIPIATLTHDEIAQQLASWRSEND